MPQNTKNILLLCAEAARHTGTVDAHIRAFDVHSKYNVVTLDASVAGQLDIDLSLFDAVVFHYSIIIADPRYIALDFAEKLTQFQGPKTLFIQDEFRWVDRTVNAAKALGVAIVYTVVNRDVIRKIYRDPYFDNVRFEQTLTGFVPEELLAYDAPAYKDRRLDIAYRARKLPGWCGGFAQQKWQIGERVADEAVEFDLKCDIAMSEASRIYGEKWIEFMANSRATLGTESGASFVDFTGLVHQEIDAYEAKNPGADFEEVREKFLEGSDGDIIIHVISPRVFEAAALKTLMIMYPGEYSGIVVAGRHYVELLPDHSNFAEVVNILNDPQKAGAIIDNAYREIACSPKWTHRAFIEGFDTVLEQEFSLSPGQGSPSTSMNQIEKQVEFDRLVNLSKKWARNAKIRMQIILFIQGIRVWVFSTIERVLPPVLSTPILNFGRAITGLIKPFLRKFLL